MLCEGATRAALSYCASLTQVRHLYSDFLGLEAVQPVHGLGHVLFEQDVGGVRGHSSSTSSIKACSDFFSLEAVQPVHCFGHVLLEQNVGGVRGHSSSTSSIKASLDFFSLEAV
jgi:hypothetical protein